MNASSQARLARVRDLMAARGYDALALRNVSDLRWITDAERVFDDECAHTALVTAGGAWIHTDSRYFNALAERLGQDSPWQLDMGPETHPEWLARKASGLRLRVLAVEDTLTLGFFEELEAALSAVSCACLMPRLHGDVAVMRAVKDEAEVALMRRAQAITDAAFAHMCAWLRPGVTELQARAELDGWMLSNGADSLSFGTIVASGPNTANPHAQPGSRVIEPGDFVLMDYGAGLNGYKSDMTRTVVMGEPDERQRQLYDLVRSVNEACEREIKPGVSSRAVYDLSVRLISEAGFGDYFKHGLGHGVGVDIHERPFLSARFDEPLAVGNVVTVEPGVYLPGIGGVRLEDYGVVTDAGYDVFTSSSHDLVCIKSR